MHSKKKKWNFFDQFSTLKNDYENQNFEISDEVVHDFCKFDENTLWTKNFVYIIFYPILSGCILYSRGH